jgi:hypothetical protein
MKLYFIENQAISLILYPYQILICYHYKIIQYRHSQAYIEYNTYAFFR